MKTVFVVNPAFIKCKCNFTLFSQESYWKNQKITQTLLLSYNFYNCLKIKLLHFRNFRITCRIFFLLTSTIKKIFLQHPVSYTNWRHRNYFNCDDGGRTTQYPIPLFLSPPYPSFKDKRVLLRSLEMCTSVTWRRRGRILFSLRPTYSLNLFCFVLVVCRIKQKKISVYIICELSAYDTKNYLVHEDPICNLK